MGTHAVPDPVVEHLENPWRQVWLASGAAAAIIVGLILVFATGDPARSPAVSPADATALGAVPAWSGPVTGTADTVGGASPAASTAGSPGTVVTPPSTAPGRSAAGAGAAARPLPPAPATSAGATFAADYSSSAWSSGYLGQIVVRNVGSAAGTWSVQIQLPAGVQILGVWNASATHTGATYRFGPVGGAALRAGGSVTFGYLATRGSGPYQPDSCTVNGSPCH